MHEFTWSWPEIRTKASRAWCFRTHTMIGSHQLISDASTPTRTYYCATTYTKHCSVQCADIVSL